MNNQWVAAVGSRGRFLADKHHDQKLLRRAQRGVHLDSTPYWWCSVPQSWNEEQPNASTSTMNESKEPIASLSQIEAEVLAEGREWTRRRLQERLQELAEQHGEFSP